MLIQQKYNRWYSQQIKKENLQRVNQNDLAFSPPNDEIAKKDKEKEYKKKLRNQGSTYQDNYQRLDAASLLEFAKKYSVK